MPVHKGWVRCTFDPSFRTDICQEPEAGHIAQNAGQTGVATIASDVHLMEFRGTGQKDTSAFRDAIEIAREQLGLLDREVCQLSFSVSPKVECDQRIKRHGGRDAGGDNDEQTRGHA